MCLDNEEKKELDSEVTEDELGEALYRLRSHKTPGCDSLQSEFYKVFLETC